MRRYPTKFHGRAPCYCLSCTQGKLREPTRQEVRAAYDQREYESALTADLEASTVAPCLVRSESG